MALNNISNKSIFNLFPLIRGDREAIYKSFNNVTRNILPFVLSTTRGLTKRFNLRKKNECQRD